MIPHVNRFLSQAFRICSVISISAWFVNAYFWIQIDSCFVQWTYGLFFWLFYWCLGVKILVYSFTLVLQPFLCTGKILPTLRIDGNLSSEKVWFIKSDRDSPRDFWIVWIAFLLWSKDQCFYYFKGVYIGLHFLCGCWI